MDDPASLFLLLFAETGSAEESVNYFFIAFKLFAVIVLVLLNGYFVAAEFAYVAVRKSRIKVLAEEGLKSAKRLMEILNNMNPYLSACQLGITIASLALGTLAEPAVAELLARPLSVLPEAARHPVALIISLAIITSLHITVGEQAPKLLGLELAEKVALWTALPTKIFYTIFKVPIHALDRVSVKMVGVFGLHAGGEHGSIYSEDELRQLIDISKRSGHLNEEEQKLIHQVFEFSETTVREAMIPRTEIVAIPVTVSLEELAESFQEHGFSRVPVFRESLDDIAGVVHSKDVMIALLSPESFRIEKILRKPIYVVDTARLEDVLRQMQEEKFHFGFVVDEHGGVEGIITLEDLLEEIVGEIADEYDQEAIEQIHKQEDGSYVLDGSLAVRDMNKRLGLDVPVSESYTTIAGFLMSEAGQVLETGESVKFNGHDFRVEEVDKRRILKVRMEKR
ncbi:MAG: HlyC/CorC family transporter [Pyrinomonadaceae bacterium]|nr:HlyC/CorC family transporter [Pyrinomonadaceae bacterium]